MNLTGDNISPNFEKLADEITSIGLNWHSKTILENSKNKNYTKNKTDGTDLILTKKPIRTKCSFNKFLNRLHLILTVTNLFLIIAVRLHYTNDVLVSSYLSIITWKYIDIYFKLQKS